MCTKLVVVGLGSLDCPIRRLPPSGGTYGKAGGRVEECLDGGTTGDEGFFLGPTRRFSLRKARERAMVCSAAFFPSWI